MSMLDIELNLNKIQEFGKKREDQNWKFRTFLKGEKIEKIDRIVHRLYADISSKIDCTLCGNCCVKLKPSLNPQDIKIISDIMKISEEEFKTKHIENEDGDLFLNWIPCNFLIDKKCSIYNNRPEDCRSYPNLHKNDFVHRLFGVLDNYSICPIVYNVFEQLKRELNFK